MEECGVRGEADPNPHLVNKLEDELNDQAGDELEHELKLGGKHQRGRVAGSVEARFQSTDIRMVSLISSQLCQVWSNNVNQFKTQFSEMSEWISPNAQICPLKMSRSFYLNGTGRPLFRLGCFASPRKRPFLLFFAGLRCHHTDEWRESQSSRYHSKCHNWTVAAVLEVFPKNHFGFLTKIWREDYADKAVTLECVYLAKRLRVFSFNNTLKIIILTE